MQREIQFRGRLIGVVSASDHKKKVESCFTHQRSSLRETTVVEDDPKFEKSLDRVFKGEDDLCKHLTISEINQTVHMNNRMETILNTHV